MLALLAPHLVLGGWLLLVPDHVAFTASQLVVLAHVTLGLFGVPVAAWWTWQHVVRSRGRARRTALARLVRRVLTMAVAAAFLSGLPALWSGQGMPIAWSHSVLGAAVAVPLALHLWLERRHAASLAVSAGLAAAIAGVLLARRLIPPDAPTPRQPSFTYELRPLSLYDEAAWCGSCHARNYAEWSHSVHGRTMGIGQFRMDLGNRPASLGVDLGLFGRALRDRRGGPLPASIPLPPDQCPLCHSPTSYFGDDPVSPLEATGPSREGVTCSFCHTLRGVHFKEEANALARQVIGRIQRGEVKPSHEAALGIYDYGPMYVSAPETVRRYLGQAAPSRLLRWVGDYLIRWRPEMHRRDYHTPFLDSSRACQVCHGLALDAPETPHKTYPDWEASEYNSADRDARVECQDCHMVREITGRPVREPDRLVPWGPRRPQRRSHLFLGGNAKADLLFQDQDTAARQHQLVSRSLRLAIDSAAVEERRLRVQVTVHNDRVGHFFPGMETVQRVAWVQLAAYDARGQLIVETARPTIQEPDRSESLLLFRFVDSTMHITRDTTVPPRGSRTLAGRVLLPAGAPPVARVQASLYHSFDPDPVQVASRELPAANRAPPSQ